MLLDLFDAAGMRISAGSACSAAKAEPSFVLQAMGLPEWRTTSAVRLSFGALADEDFIDQGLRRDPAMRRGLARQCPARRKHAAGAGGQARPPPMAPDAQARMQAPDWTGASSNSCCAATRRPCWWMCARPTNTRQPRHCAARAGPRSNLPLSELEHAVPALAGRAPASGGVLLPQRQPQPAGLADAAGPGLHARPAPGRRAGVGPAAALGAARPSPGAGAIVARWRRAVARQALYTAVPAHPTKDLKS